MRRLRFTFRLKHLLIVATCFAVLSAYLGSYYRLANRGREEAVRYDLDSFFYVPIDEVMRTHDLTKQRRLARFYAPAWAIDRLLFGGTPPVTSMMFRLTD